MATIDEDEALSFLGMKTSDDIDELRRFIATTEAAWAAAGLPCAIASRTDELDGCTPALILYGTPVVAVTSLTEYGASVDPALLSVAKKSGVVKKLSGAEFRDPVIITYTWGFATVPDDIKHALMLLLKHLWETQRASNRRNGEPDVGSAYTWPNRVLQLARPYMPVAFG